MRTGRSSPTFWLDRREVRPGNLRFSVSSSSCLENRSSTTHISIRKLARCRVTVSTENSLDQSRALSSATYPFRSPISPSQCRCPVSSADRAMARSSRACRTIPSGAHIASLAARSRAALCRHGEYCGCTETRAKGCTQTSSFGKRYAVKQAISTTVGGGAGHARNGLCTYSRRHSDDRCGRSL